MACLPFANIPPLCNHPVTINHDPDTPFGNSNADHTIATDTFLLDLPTKDKGKGRQDGPSTVKRARIKSVIDVPSNK
jgi:hypothetical protein